MIKILKTSTYNDLIREIDSLKNAVKRSNVALHAGLEDRSDLETKIAFDLSIKRCLVGTKGTGKTTLIKKMLLPQLHGNYFLIDLFNEYPEVPADKKYVMNLQEKGEKEAIKEAIIKNKDRATIVIDSADYYPDLTWFFDIIGDSNFIISVQNQRRIEKFMDHIKLVYLFRTNNGYYQDVEFERDFRNKIYKMNNSL